MLVLQAEIGWRDLATLLGIVTGTGPACRSPESLKMYRTPLRGCSQTGRAG